MLNSLDQIRRTLLSTLNNPSLFSLVNTRVILRTGVDLGGIRPLEDKNPEAVNKVLTALRAMGYVLSDDQK